MFYRSCYLVYFFFCLGRDSRTMALKKLLRTSCPLPLVCRYWVHVPEKRELCWVRPLTLGLSHAFSGGLGLGSRLQAAPRQRLPFPVRRVCMGVASQPGPSFASDVGETVCCHSPPPTSQCAPPSYGSDSAELWPLSDVKLLFTRCAHRAAVIHLSCTWLLKCRSWSLRWCCESGLNRWQHQSCISSA